MKSDEVTYGSILTAEVRQVKNMRMGKQEPKVSISAAII